MNELELTEAEEQDASFVREIIAVSGGFRPFALFDEPLDCIRVAWRDCSTTEIRVNDLLTVLEANYPAVKGASEIVGFSIKGVAHICETHNIPASAPWRLADFIDAVLNGSAPREQVFVKNIVKREVEQRHLDEVDKMAA